MDAGMRFAAGMLLYAAVALTLMEYVFRPEFFIRHYPDHSRAHGGLYPHLWWALGNILLYLPIPMLILRIGYRMRLHEFGWQLKLSSAHVVLYGAMLAIVLPLVFVAASQPDFLAIYPFYRAASQASLWAVVAWEVAYLSYYLALEFFFRGILAIGLGRVMGRLAIWVAVVPYAMIHFHKPLPEVFAAIVAGLVLGEIAQRTRSIAGGVIAHIGVAFTMDMLAMQAR